MAKRLLKKTKRKRPTRVRRAARTLYRTAVVLSALVVVLFCAYQALVHAPEQAPPPTAEVPSRSPASDNPDTPED